MGIALGLRSFNHAIKIVVSGPEWRYSVFTELADHKFYTHEEAFLWLTKQTAPKVVREGACCANEQRNFNGGCDNCGDPSF